MKMTNPNPSPIGLGFGFILFGAGDRIWTGTMLPPRDFKSLASAYSATPADASHIYINVRMDGGGFEPPKQIAADLQSVPFGHSGIHPYGIVFHKADDRTRTDNLLITNQLLCQLSHIGITNKRIS